MFSWFSYHVRRVLRQEMVVEADMAMPNTPCMHREFSRPLSLRESCASGTTSLELVPIKGLLSPSRIMWKPLRCTPLEKQVCKFRKLCFNDHHHIMSYAYDCFEYIGCAWYVSIIARVKKKPNIKLLYFC